MNKIVINKTQRVGKIRPMHAVNNGPVSSAGAGRFEYLKEAGIPYARLHDTGGVFGASVYVDIDNVFRDFNADPSEANNYDFAFTDWLLEQLTANGTTPFYRLGTTIENGHKIKAYRIFPPKDNFKWAKICEGIIRHYTQGWANGYYYDMPYWEIWNEPDNEPNAEDNPMWKGTKEQFFALYQTTACYLKEKFPHLKIGGYGSCGFYKIARITASPNANISARIDYFVEFFRDFLDYIRDEKHSAPLDFFSWHSYADQQSNVIFADYARKTLDEFGFTETEHFCTEWNPGISLRGKLRDATNIAANMLAWHKTTLGMAMYYDWNLNSLYCGAFDCVYRTPLPAFYVFKAFDRLYRLQEEIMTSVDNPLLYALGAQNNGQGALMLVNYTNETQTVSVSDLGDATVKVCAIDEKHDYEKPFLLSADSILNMEKDAVLLLEWEEK